MLPVPPTAAALAARALPDAGAGWGVGTFGAIAEFVRAADEPVERDARMAITTRGAIAIDLPDDARAIAWERPTAAGAWQQGIAFCLPAGRAAMHQRAVLTALGPDAGALRDRDRGAALFDLGLGALQCDACVRIADPAAARALQASAGRSAFDPGLLAELAAMQPQRVFVSRLARIEVFTPIPPRDGTTPTGPHTHVLPALLRLRRTHPANVPIPAGWVPALELFPPAALHDVEGRAIPFAADRHAAFQQLLDAFGDPVLVAAKRRVEQAVLAGEPPHESAGSGRAERLARRVALRQLAFSAPRSPVLGAWRARFDAPTEAVDELNGDSR